MRKTEDLCQIVRNGGGLRIDATHYTTEDLAQIARNAAQKASITFVGLSYKTTEDLCHIARNGRGSVVFEL